MIEMVQFDYIRFLFFNKGNSIRSIAKLLGIHRNTVRKAIQNPTYGYRQSKPKPKPVNEPYLERIRFLIQENHATKKKDRRTKKSLYKTLVQEGYAGSYSTFTWQVRQVEEDLGMEQKEAFVKLLPLR